MHSPDSFTTLLDAMCRSDLESLRDRYATCIFWSTAAVAVGCAMEVPEVIHELWTNLFPAKFERLIKAVSSVGLLLVILGVGGELAFDHWRSAYEDLLQTFNNVLLVDAELQAVAAQHDAGNARDAANEAEEAAGQARKEAESVFAIAAQANESARGALAMAGDAKAEAAMVATNVAKVDAKYAPRTLSKTKRQILIELLRGAATKPKRTINIEVSVDAPDGSAYADEIADAISEPSTGWTAVNNGNLMTSDGKCTGVRILVHDANSAPPWAGELQHAMQWAGIGGLGAYNASVRAGDSEILVCRKN